MRKLAAEIDRAGADAVVFSAETWLAIQLPLDDPQAELRAGERADRQEGFTTHLLQKSGPNLMFLSLFSRGGDAKIQLSDAVESEVQGPTSFEPILRVWRRWDSSIAGTRAK